MQGYWKTSELEGDNAAYLESLYEDYLNDPESVDAKWRVYFENLKGTPAEAQHSAVKSALIEMAKHPQALTATAGISAEDRYRQYGHLLAEVDPLGLLKHPSAAELGLDPGLEPFKAWYCGAIGYEFMYL